MIVVNSSPIIILGKQSMLHLLKGCFKKIIIPNSVFNEIMQQEDSPEAMALKKVINDLWISIEKTTVNPYLHTRNLGQGEKEAISLALKHKSILLIDDDSAKTYSEVLGVEVHGTFYVIYLAIIRKIIPKEEAKKILERMIADGFYISTDVYSRFLNLLNSM
jgi:uncharacterized protein